MPKILLSQTEQALCAMVAEWATRAQTEISHQAQAKLRAILDDRGIVGEAQFDLEDEGWVLNVPDNEE